MRAAARPSASRSGWRAVGSEVVAKPGKSAADFKLGTAWDQVDVSDFGFTQQQLQTIINATTRTTIR
jgi:hypothetical protein